jgi:hypothetical protein
MKVGATFIIVIKMADQYRDLSTVSLPFPLAHSGDKKSQCLGASLERINRGVIKLGQQI